MRTNTYTIQEKQTLYFSKKEIGKNKYCNFHVDGCQLQTSLGHWEIQKPYLHFPNASPQK